MEKGKFLQLLKNQTSIEDDLVHVEPEKMKKVKRQRNKMIENQEKMKEHFERLNTSGEEVKDVLKVRNNGAGLALKQAKKQEADGKQMDWTERIKSLERKLEQMRKEEGSNYEALEETVHQHYRRHQKQLRKEEQIRNSAEAEKISDLESCIRNMENSLSEKELEIWNLRQFLKDAGFHVANSIANIVTRSAVKIGNLQRENEELRERQKLLENRIYEYDQELQVDSTKMVHEVMNGARSKIDRTQKKLCEAPACIRSAKFNANVMEKKWREAEEEKNILINYLKEITIAKSDLLKANYSLNEEVKLQDERLLVIEEKFENIEEICSQEKTRNQTVVDGMKSIENKVKGIQDLMSNGKKRRKNIIQRFIARSRNRNDNL